MSATTREEIAAAFFALLETVPGVLATSRRFIPWDHVNETQMPFLTMLKTGEGRLRQDDGAEGLPILTLRFRAFIYISAGMDPDDVPDTAMNALLDALDATVKPSGTDLLANRQTLGGLVSHCYPLGRADIYTGDVDGKGIAAIPFEILTGWFV
jgi:hypothetical protein